MKRELERIFRLRPGAKSTFFIFENIFYIYYYSNLTLPLGLRCRTRPYRLVTVIKRTQYK